MRNEPLVIIPTIFFLSAALCALLTLASNKEHSQ